MRLIRISLLLLAACKAPQDRPATQATPTPEHPVRPNTTTFSRGTGGGITTSLQYGIKVDPNSSLTREWITGHDSLSPADPTGTIGVTTIYKPGGEYTRGEYYYQAVVPLSFKEDISAFEIRFVLFDVWGQFSKTLSYTEVEDEAGGTAKSFTPLWEVYSENEVSEYYASIAYVARVRTKAGKVFEANYDPVVDEARTITAKFQPEWLEPNRPPTPDSSRTRK